MPLSNLLGRLNDSEMVPSGFAVNDPSCVGVECIVTVACDPGSRPVAVTATELPPAWSPTWAEKTTVILIVGSGSVEKEAAVLAGPCPSSDTAATWMR